MWPIGYFLNDDPWAEKVENQWSTTVGGGPNGVQWLQFVPWLAGSF